MSINHHDRFVKIICTLGPSSNTYEKIKELAVAGMDIARLNFSHGTHDDHKKLIGIIRKVSSEVGLPIAILQDLQGPKIRVKKFENGYIDFPTGKEFTLTTRDVIGNDDIVSVSLKSLHEDVKPGDPILLDDGNLRIIVKEINGQDVRCVVEFGGVLKDHKGINIPGSSLSVSSMSEKDDKDLKFGLENDVDFIALSFVQKPEDVSDIKKKISDYGKNIPVIAKIEKPQAVESIEEILKIVDVIMIARGDLGVEMLTEEVPPIQKKIIQLCNDSGVPVITATQMLDSMITNPRPTRAESTDVANAVLDGTDAVMLSGETASGAYPVEAVKTMDNIVKLIEDSGFDRTRRMLLMRRDPAINYETGYAISFSACDAARLVKAKAILCMTQTGYSAKLISRFRTKIPTYAITPKMKTYYKTALYWGVKGVKIDEFPDNFDHSVDEIIKMMKAKGYINTGDRIILTAGAPFSMKLQTNTIRIETVK